MACNNHGEIAAIQDRLPIGVMRRGKDMRPVKLFAAMAIVMPVELLASQTMSQPA